MTHLRIDLEQAIVRLDEAERRVNDAQLRLGRQLLLTAELRNEGRSTDRAEELLTLFIDIFASFVCRRDRLLKEARSKLPPPGARTPNSNVLILSRRKPFGEQR
jgi:hypothetical protein